MSTDPLYDLKEPTQWAEPPRDYSFSTLQSLRACPRRWQLAHSAWGPHARFPERPHPAAIEGEIVHEALDLLARELGRRGRPAIASADFRGAVERCGFWAFFTTQIDAWNRRLAAHPRAGPRYVVRTKPRDLANQTISLFRDRYQPGDGESFDARAADTEGNKRSNSSASPLALLQARGALSEVRLDHPSLPLTGVLDLVMLEPDLSATVVDFKTGERKPAHKDQVLFYALLWWRAAGTRPGKAVLQYLDSSWAFSPEEPDLVAVERIIAKEIDRARDALSARPAAAVPGHDCTWCPVRPRCNEGWAWGERASRAATTSKTVDIEVTVSSNPTATGFLGTRSNGDEISVVFDAAVGCGLPPAKPGDRFRIVDAIPRPGDREITLLPWTEMYRL